LNAGDQNIYDIFKKHFNVQVDIIKGFKIGSGWCGLLTFFNSKLIFG